LTVHICGERNIFTSGDDFQSYYLFPVKFTSKRHESLTFEIAMDEAKREFNLKVNLTPFEELPEAVKPKS